MHIEIARRSISFLFLCTAELLVSVILVQKLVIGCGSCEKSSFVGVMRL